MSQASELISEMKDMAPETKEFGVLMNKMEFAKDKSKPIDDKMMTKSHKLLKKIEDDGLVSPNGVKAFKARMEKLMSEALSGSEISKAEKLLPRLLKFIKPKTKGKMGGRAKEHFDALDRIGNEEELSDKEVKLILQLADMYGV